MTFQMRAIKLTTLVFILILPIQNFSQENQIKIVVNEFHNKLTESLSPYHLGSGFSIILFRYTKTNRYEQISVLSSNFKSREIIKKSVDSSSSFFDLKNAKPGFFALPIIQIMFDDNKTDHTKTDDLNWSNNNSWEMSNFKLLSKMPDKTIFLKPIIIMGSPPISKKIN